MDIRRVEESTVVVEEQEDTILPIENTSRMWNCVMRNMESTVVVEEQEDTILPIENINKMWKCGMWNVKCGGYGGSGRAGRYDSTNRDY